MHLYVTSHCEVSLRTSNGVYNISLRTSNLTFKKANFAKVNWLPKYQNYIYEMQNSYLCNELRKVHFFITSGNITKRGEAEFRKGHEWWKNHISQRVAYNILCNDERKLMKWKIKTYAGFHTYNLYFDLNTKRSKYHLCYMSLSP